MIYSQNYRPAQPIPTLSSLLLYLSAIFKMQCYTVVKRFFKLTFGTFGNDVDTDCEIVWASLQLKGCKKLLLASYYRPPKSSVVEIEQFCTSVDKVFASHSPNYPQVLIGGDFNLPGINWEYMSVNSHIDDSKSLTLLDCLHSNNFTQLIEKPTRGNNILDLPLTSNPNIASNEEHASSPSHDHDAVFFDIDIRPKLNHKPGHNIYMYNKADMEKLEQEINNISHEFCFMQSTSELSIDENWNYFYSILLS